MLDVGFSEILLTSAIALIVLGPERLPKVARQVGNWMGRARAMARQLSEQLEREVSEVDSLNKQVNSLNVDNMLKAPIKPVPNNPNPLSYAPSSDVLPADVAPPNGPPAPSEQPPTSPAAMHASDPKVTDPQTATADASSPHD
jgi:sec-independent protein translocase protein TatB